MVVGVGDIHIFLIGSFCISESFIKFEISMHLRVERLRWLELSSLCRLLFEQTVNCKRSFLGGIVKTMVMISIVKTMMQHQDVMGLRWMRTGRKLFQNTTSKRWV